MRRRAAAGRVARLNPARAAAALLPVVTILAACLSGQAQAQTTYVSTLAETEASSLSGSAMRAQTFTTGSQAGGYALTSVDVAFRVNPGVTVAASIYSTTGSDPYPDAALYSLTAPGTYDAVTVSPHTFTAPANTTLAANTTYAVVITPAGSLALGRTNSNAESEAATGWSVGDAYHEVQSGSPPWRLTATARSMLIAVTGPGGATPTLSDDATLSDLELEDDSGAAIALTPAFVSGTTTYTATVVNAVDEITVIPTVNESNATFEIQDGSGAALTDADTSADDFQVDLPEGDTEIQVEVTAQDTSSMETYTITVTRAAMTTVPPSEVMVPNDWSLIPTGLDVGDKFRLIFLSSMNTDATSTDIADYNTFIQNLAAAGHTDIQAYSAGFRAVGCTAGSDARDNTATTGTGELIHWLNGNKVADDYTDFYDGDWDDEFNDKEEDGTDGPNTSAPANYPWTGCKHDGTAETNQEVSLRQLGADVVRVGIPNSNDSNAGPLSSGGALVNTETRPMYGLSQVFEVAAATAGVTVTETALTVTEEDSAGETYTVVLDSEPTASVVIDVGGHASTDVTAAPASLTFTTTNWDTARTVTVTAGDDANTADETVNLTHSATSTDSDYGGITIAGVTVTVEDNDTPAADLPWSTTMTVGEGTEHTQGSLTAGGRGFNKLNAPNAFGALADEDFVYGSTTFEFDNLVANPSIGVGGSVGLFFTHVLTDAQRAALILEFAGETLPLANSISYGGTVSEWTAAWLATNASSLTLANYRTTLPDGGMVTICIRTATQVCPGGTTPTLSDDATLSNLELENSSGTAITLGPAFVPGTTAYTATVGNAVDEITVIPTPNESNATFEIQDGDGTALTDADSTADEFQVDISEGDNKIQVEVTAQDGTSMETYEVTVTRSRRTTTTPAAPPEIEVPNDWGLIPAGLGTGDKFRLIFLSSTKTNGESYDIADYNTFIQGRAAAGHTDIQAYSSGFRAVGCTADSDARDNTATTGTGVRIHWLNGNKVADNYGDFKDGDWDDEANDKNEDGNDGPNTSTLFNYPYTGCKDNGTEAFTNLGSSQALGAPGKFVIVGRPNSSGSGDGPLSSASAAENDVTRPMYGLSQVFEVAAATQGVTISETTLTVTEQDTTGDTYTVVLDSEPTANVTVAVGGHASTDVTAAPASLTFTTANWDTARTVTVTAGDDANTADETVNLTHAATSNDSDYSGITIAGVTVTAEDNDTAKVGGLRLTPDSQQLAVRWNRVSNATGYQLQWKSGTQNYNSSSRQLNPSPGSDTDSTLVNLVNGDEYTLRVRAVRTGANNGPWSDEVMGTPGSPGVTVSPGTLTVTEEDSAGGSYTVVLDSWPTANVVIEVGGHASTDLSVTPASLTFTQTTWETAQEVTVTAGDDANTENETIDLTHTATSTDSNYGGISIRDVTVTAEDDDTAKVTGVGLTPNNGQLVVRWTSVSNATGYRIQWKSGGDGYNNTNQIDVTSGSDTARAILGLTNGTEYTLRMRAVRTGANNGPWSDEAMGTPTPPGVTVSEMALTVTEEDGAGDTYTVVLNTPPTSSVTIEVGGLAGTDVTAAPSTLTFTSTNWNTARTVTVTAGDDADIVNETFTLTHSATSVDSSYDGVTIAGVAVEVEDNDTAKVTGLRLTPGDGELEVEWLTLSNATGYQVQWKSGSQGYNNSGRQATIGFGSIGSHTIPNLNNGTTYTVRVRATRTGANNGPYSDEEMETPRAPGTLGVRISETALTLVEEDIFGDSYTVVLYSEPTANVVIEVAGHATTDVSVTPDSLTFTPTNWNTAQEVTVTAGDDANTENETIDLTHSATSNDSDYGGIMIDGVTVTVGDNDPLWVANMTVEVSTNSTVAWGYGFVSTGSIYNYGSLDDTMFDFGADEYTVTRLEASDGSTSDQEYVWLDISSTGAIPDPIGLTLEWGGAEFSLDDLSFGRALSDGELFWRANDNKLHSTSPLAPDNIRNTLVPGSTVKACLRTATQVCPDTTVVLTAGVTVSETALTVTEEDSTGDSYTVVLGSEPTANVVIEVGGHATTDVTAAPASLTFTPTNWNTAQEVTVTAGDDANTENETIDLTHSATSTDSDYDGITIAEVTVTAEDNDTAQVTGLVLMPGDGELVVQWVPLPNATGYEVQWKSGGQSYNNSGRQATISAGSTVSHTIPNLTNGTTYTVRVRATRTGANPGAYSDEEMETPMAPGVTISDTALTVVEEDTFGETYTVVLNTQPTANVTVTVAGHSGTDVTVAPSTLTFTTTTWATAQEVTLTAGGDANTANETVNLTHTATSADSDYGGVTVDGVTVTVGDNDPFWVANMTVEVSTYSTTAWGYGFRETGSIHNYGSLDDTTFSIGVDEYTVVRLDAQDGTTSDQDYVNLEINSSADFPDPNGLTLEWGGAEFSLDDFSTGTDFSEGSLIWRVSDNKLPSTSPLAPDNIRNTLVPGSTVKACLRTATQVCPDTTVVLTAGVTVSKTALTVTEEDSAGDSYTVALGSPPTANVVVTVAGHSGTALTPMPATLTFTATNWSTPRTVTVTAATDANTADETVSLTHSAASTDSDYNGITIAGVTVMVEDNDITGTPGVTISETALTVVEEDTAGESYTIVLDSRPTGDVALTVDEYAETDVTPNPDSLMFTRFNWDTPQTVTVTAGNDGDADDDRVALKHYTTSTDITYTAQAADLIVTVTDNDDTAQVTGLTLTPADGELVANWTAVTDATGYEVQWKSGGQSYNSSGRQAVVASGSTVVYTIPNLTNGTTYTVRVRATQTGADAGAYSDEEMAAPAAGATTTVSISADKTSAVFKEDGIDYTLTRSGSTTDALDVSVVLSQTRDFLLTADLTRTVTIAAGQSTGTFTAAASSFQHFAAGTTVEAGTLTAAVQDGTDYDLGTTSAVNVAIVIGVMVRLEGVPLVNEGTASFTFKVVARTGAGAPQPSAPTGNISVSTEDISAIRNTDYGFVAGSLNIQPGNFTSDGAVWEAETTYTVSVENDALDEDDETFNLVIERPQASRAYSLVDASGNSCGAKCTLMKTITDDDYAGVTVSKSTLTVTEEDTAGDSYTLVLDSQPTANVNIAIGGNSGEDVITNLTIVDFTPMNWDTARAVGVTAIDDSDFSFDTVTLTHIATSTDSNYSGIAVADVTVTVEDNDTVQVTGLMVTPGNAQLVAQWTAVGNATGYEVQWKSGVEVYDSTRQATVTSGTTTSYTIPSLTNGTEYTVRVRAIRTGANSGAYSDEEMETPAAPTTLTPPPEITVPHNWSLIPTGLGAGDKFRLIFLSSTKTNATSTDIADYNTFIQNRAVAGHTDIQAYSMGFRAVGCTTAFDARDNAVFTGTGVVIHWLNGNKVADNYGDFSDGTWDAESNSDDRNELGANGTNTSNDGNYPFTGCEHNGAEATFGGSSRALGTSNVRVGILDHSSSDHGPLSSNTNPPSSSNRPMYGLSQVFEVGAAPPPELSFASNTVTVNEDVGSAPITVNLDPASTGTVTVDYATRLSSAKAGEDYTATSGTLTFTAGQTSKTITVPITDDDVYENNETFFVDLSNPTGATLPDPVSISVNIISDEAVPTASMADVTVDEGAGTMTLTLRLSHPSQNDISYLTIAADVAGTATEGDDYDDFLLDVGRTEEVTVPALSLSQTFDITIVDDTVAEPDETIVIVWRKGASDTVTPQFINFTGTITNNDTAGVTLSKSTLTVTEEDTAGDTYTVVLDSQPTASVAVGVGGTSGTDVTAAPASLTFTTANWNTARTVTVTAADDSDTASDTVTLTHTATSTDTAYEGIVVDSVTVTVNDNDTANTAPAFSSSTANRSVAENTAAGQNVGAVLTATDDDGDTLTYSLEGTDMASFDLDTTTTAGSARIQTRTGVTYNHEAKSTYTVVVKADDSNGGTDTVTVMIAVTDVTEAPGRPAAPTLTAVGGGATLLIAEWLEPTNTGPGIDTYDLRYQKTTESAWTDGPQDQIPSGVGGSVIMDGLEAGTTYRVQVRATSDEGDSEWSPSGTGMTSGFVHVRFEQATHSVAEGGNVTVKVILSADPGRNLDIPIQRSSQGGANNADYSINTASVVFASGEMESDALVFSATQDSIDDDGESVRLSFGNLPPAVEVEAPATTTVSITDDDAAGVTVSKTTLTVTEQDTTGDTYTVVLNSQPTEDVGILILGQGSEVVTTPTPLDFTPMNWDTARTVTVKGLNDLDLTDDTVTLTHTATSTDSKYSGIAIADLTVTVEDDDTAQVTGLMVTPGNAQLVAQWTAVPATGYEVQWKSGVEVYNTGGRQATVTPGTTTSYTITGLTNGTEYTVRVRAIRTGANPGAYSDEVMETPVATTLTPPPEIIVPHDWSLIPTGLGAGDKFRLIFLSSTKTNATSTDIAIYNTFIQNRVANGGHTDIQAYSSGFRAVGCTAAFDARDNAVFTGTGVVIHWLNGNKVADNYADFSDGTWDDEANNKDEDGANGLDTSVTANWPITGCEDDGTEWIVGVTRALGAPGGFVRVGRPNSTDSGNGPLSGNDTAGISSTRPMYGLSQVFEVGAAAPALSFASNYVTVDEDAGTVTLTVNLAPASTGTVTVGYATRTRSGGATAGEDYTTTSGMLTFAATETSKTFTVPILDDDVYENDEIFLVDLSNPAGATLPDPRTTSVNIDSEDAVPTVSMADVTVDEGAGKMTLTFQLSHPSERDIAYYTLYDEDDDTGTATEGEDYDDFLLGSEGGTTVSITVPAGSLSQTFDITIVDDGVDEPDETIKVYWNKNISSEATPNDLTFTGTITDNDTVESTPTVRFGASAYTSIEGLPGAEVTVLLEPAATHRVTVPVTTTPQDGASSADYSDVPASVTFDAGVTEQTFTVTATDDSVDDEGESESVLLGFGDLPSGVQLGSPSTATVALVQDADVSTWYVWFDKSSYTVTEGGSARITLHLNSPWKPKRNEALTVPLFDPEHQGGASADDYYGLPKSVTFQPGQTQVSFTVRVTDDIEDDDGESVLIQFRRWPQADLEPGRYGAYDTTLHIADNDGEKAVTVSFDAANYTAAEGGATATVKLRLDTAPGRSVTIPLTKTHRGASTADYSGVPGSVTFGASETVKSFTLTATDDTDDDNLESVVIGFGSLPSKVSAGSPSEAVLQLTDNDPPGVDAPSLQVRFDASAGAVRDGVEEDGIYRLGIRLSAKPGVKLTIPLTYAYMGGATAGDFSNLPANVTFGKNATSSGVTIRPVDDFEEDPGESLKVSFGSLPAGVSVNPWSGRSTIIPVIDNDAAPGLSVSDASAREWPGKKVCLNFVVTMDLMDVDHEVSVDYTTVDGTAVAGQDFKPISGTLVFRPSESRRRTASKNLCVEVIDDSHDEGLEEMTLVLSNPVRAYLADDTGVGQISNTDKMPGAWLTRFGRAATDHVVEAVGERWQGGTQTPHLTLGGRQAGDLFGWAGLGGLGGRDTAVDRDDPAGAGADISATAPGMSLLDMNTAPGGAGGVEREAGKTQSGRAAQGALLRALGLPDPRAAPDLRTLLMGSSFFYSAALDEDGESRSPGRTRLPGWLGEWSAWGRTASSRFSGADGNLRLDGEVATAMLGFDSRWNRWLTGVVVSFSEGQGAYTHPTASGGAVASTMTGLNPYARFELNERTSVWGVLGYGAGDLSLTPAGSEKALETDLTNAMAAFGGRTALSVRAGEAGRFELALRSDARLTNTASEAIEGLVGAEGRTARVRLMLEGSGSMRLATGGVLKPKLETGLRYDTGDAETGTGLEVGGGLGYAAGRLSAEVNARGLVAHRDTEYEEWGFSGSIAYTPSEDGRGLSMRLGSAWGATQSGVQSLWSRQDASGLVSNAAFEAAQRYQVELRYGLDGKTGRARWEPFVGVESAAGSSRALRLGVKLTSGQCLDAALELGWRQGRPGTDPEQAVQLRGVLRC